MYRMCGEGEGDGMCGGEGKRAGMDVGTMGDGGGDWDETGWGGVRGMEGHEGEADARTTVI